MTGRVITTFALLSLTLASATIAVLGLDLDMFKSAKATSAQQAADQPVQSGETRKYYIAADDVEWNYVPSGNNQITGKPIGTTDYEKLWMTKSTPTRIGSTFKKAQYREYTDASFMTLKPRPPGSEYMGLLGPVLRAEVGDTIEIVFRNNTSFDASMHPHGVFYDKKSEGAPYEDGDTNKGDDIVKPGQEYTYFWKVTERAGPMHGQSSALWMYHSHTDESKDVSTGLFGPLIVNAKGMSDASGKPKDVDREFIIAFWEVDENQSNYIQDNIKKYMQNPADVVVGEGPIGTQAVIVNHIPDYTPNVKETMNGFSYGNMPMLEMKEGEHIRWYLLSGTDFEMHSPHWHANIVHYRGMNTDVATLGSMDMGIADMVADNPGTWLFHCHVAPHLEAGMVARFHVAPK